MGSVAAKIAGNSGGSPSTGSVVLGDLAPLAPFAVIGNETASSATPTAVKMMCVPGQASTPTATASTTLTNLSKGQQVFTGVLTQTVVLPVVTTLIQAGWGYLIVNDSTGALTVNSSGGNLVQAVAAGARAFIFCNKITADTTAAAWEVVYIPVAVSIPFTAASASGPAALALAEDTDNGVNTITIKAPAAVTANVDFTLPDGAGTAALIASSISDGDTTHSPDGNSVFDALALKSPLVSPAFTGSPTINGTPIPLGGSVLAIPLANTVLAQTTGTVYSSPGSISAPLTITSEGVVSFPCPRAGTIRNLYVRTGTIAKVNTPTTTITVRKNGADTAVTLVMTETTSTTSADTTHSVSVAAGDLITVSFSVAGTVATSTSIAGVSFELG